MSPGIAECSNGSPERECNGAKPPPRQTLTGKQEHYLKRELISEQAKWEISELNSPTALHRFGAPFKSQFGEVSPLDSELPILRYIFVHHVREFPFLDKAKEKEFWQDKLQVFLESFARKNISSSDDRLEETKRRKLATKAQKLVELMMVSGIRTSSGYEERIRFTELEVVDRDAIDTSLLDYINGWDVNIMGVRMVSGKRKIRYHKHAEFILRVKRTGKGNEEAYFARRYGDFERLYARLGRELPGKVLPLLPRKNKSHTTALSALSNNFTIAYDPEVSSLSSASSPLTPTGGFSVDDATKRLSTHSLRSHARSSPIASGRASPRRSIDMAAAAEKRNIILCRESQRISLRAFLRSLLNNAEIAHSKAIEEFLTKEPTTLSDQDLEDVARRRLVDEKRMQEQRRFYEIARRRAAELDVYMEQFRQDIVERNGLTMLFKEIKEKETIQDLSIQYQKFAEWLRIEVAAIIYHLFLAEDNSPELFAQAKRIHSLIPYTVIKNVIRIANPAAVMSGVLDIFLAQPFGSRSLMQRIFSLTLHDGIKSVQKSINALTVNIDDLVLVQKLQDFADSEDYIKAAVREEAENEDVDLVVAILRSDLIEPPLTPSQIQRLFNAYVAFNSAVENIDAEFDQGALLFSHLKQLLKLFVRQRDKAMMLQLVEEPVTLQLLRDLFTIFYEPLVRVYKSANVYNSVTDFSVFVDDMMSVVEKCREDVASTDPNQTVQAFIDLCQRHEHNFYKFVHEVHTHDNGLFTQLMGWIEGILEFLRHGPKNSTLDIYALLEGAVSSRIVDKDKVIAEVDQLIKWQEARKKWHADKTRQKMAADGGEAVDLIPGALSFKSSDFGLDQMDLENMTYGDEYDSDTDYAEEEDGLSPIQAERNRRARKQDHLRRSAGEPTKPVISEVHKLKDNFLALLRMVLAE